MSAKLSQEVMGRTGSGRFVTTALIVQGPEVAEDLASLVRPHLADGDPDPGILSTINSFNRTLDASLHEMTSQDLEHYQAQATLTYHRDQRDRLVPGARPTDDRHAPQHPRQLRRSGPRSSGHRERERENP